MNAWHECARFDVFNKRDVFIENGHYLYVEDDAFDFNGNYVCREYQQGRNEDNTFFYFPGEPMAADNAYVMSLEKAPWNIARDVILRELEIMKKDYSEIEDDEAVEIIENVKDSLMEYATEDEKFIIG